MTPEQFQNLKRGERVRMHDGRIGSYGGHGDHLVIFHLPFPWWFDVYYDITKMSDPRVQRVP